LVKNLVLRCQSHQSLGDLWCHHAKQATGPAAQVCSGSTTVLIVRPLHQFRWPLWTPKKKKTTTTQEQKNNNLHIPHFECKSLHKNLHKFALKIKRFISHTSQIP
jgi:hypothetical protein